MSGKSFVSVQKGFMEKAARTFDFLEADFGLLLEPPSVRQATSTLVYSGGGLRYRIVLDPGEKAVDTLVEKDLDAVRLVAELDKLVSATGVGKANHVATSAHTMHDLERALESQAGYVRSVHPLMTGDDAVALMRKAHAYEWLRS